jgi:hypothetical protein
MIRRWITLGLTSLLSLSLLVPAALGQGSGPTCGRFSDILREHRACGAVTTLVQRGVINGYPDGTFRPESKVTRAEFAKLLIAALKVEPQPGAPVPFPDARDHWAAEMGYLQAAVDLGVLDGFPDGSFQPDGPISRAEAVKIIVAAAGLAQGSGGGAYSDIGQTWYQGFVEKAHARGLIGPSATYQVYDEPTFGGDIPASRAEAVMLLTNLLFL